MNKKLKKIFIFTVLISNSFTMGGENKKVINNKIHFENNFMKQLSLEDNESKNETSILLKLNYDILLPEFDESEELLTNENRKNEIKKLKKFYTEKNNEIVNNLDLSNYENVYVSNYSPFISLNTNWNDDSYKNLEYLAENDNIQDIYVSKNDETKNNFFSSKRVVGLNNYIYNNDPNYTGEGIVVGILETGIADVKHESLKNTDIEVRDEWYYVETVSNHTTMMAAMIAGVEGVAPKAKVLSVELFGDPVSEIDWLLERNVNVINMSFGEKNPEGKYNSFSAYIDFVVNTYKVTVVASAGNEGNGTKNVANPGLGYNVLLLSGAIGRIPKELFESAQMDGAGNFKQFSKIMIPMVWPTVITLVVLGMTNVLTLYLQPVLFNLNNNETIAGTIFNGINNPTQYPYFAAFGLLFSVILAPTILLIRKQLSRRYSDTEC